MSKVLLVMIFLCVLKNSTAQKTINIYNTQVNTVKGQLKISNVKEVIIGQIIINDQIKTRLFLKSFMQTQDSTGEYITEIKFINPDDTKLIDINIAIKCKAPILSANWDYEAGGMGISFGISEWRDLETGDITYKAEETSKKSIPMVTIRSKTKIIPSITGIDGKVSVAQSASRH